MSIDFDAVIVGAGFAGMYMLHRLRKAGFSARVLEAGEGVGGTWYWNRYPGARCDVESVQYSYQFSRELAAGVGLDRALCHPARDPALRQSRRRPLRSPPRHPVRDARCQRRRSTRRQRAGWSRPTTALGSTARFFIMATGCLSSPNTPKIPGPRRLHGATYHTGHWPHEDVDFTGKTVGVIGTGSSAIQSIPIIAEAGQAPHGVPAHRQLHHAGAQPAARSGVRARGQGQLPAMRARAKTLPAGIDFKVNMASAVETPEQERRRLFEERWDYGGLGFMAAFSDLLLNDKSQRDGRRVRARARSARSCKNPKTAELLSPKNIIGCKRLCVDTGYWETFNRPNVTLVDVSDRRSSASPPTAWSSKARRYEFDCHRVGHRLRRHDRRAAESRHPRPQGRCAEGQMERGPADLSRPRPSRASPTSSPSPARAARRC